MIKINFGNQQGISLIQVLMASTAIAGMALVGLRLAQDQKKLSIKTYQTYLLEYFSQEATHLLYDRKICHSTFAGLSPDGAKVEVIREVVKQKDGSELVRLYFPTKEKSGQTGKLFNGEFTINSFLLNGNHPEANLSKNITVLEVELSQVDKKGVVKRFIPISYRPDAQGRISSCSARVIAGEGPTEGFWRRKGEVLALPNLSAMVGKISNRNVGFAINGQLKLLPPAGARVCDNKNEGVMVYSSEGKLQYCFNNSWLPVGYNVFTWNNPKKYLLVQNKFGTVEQETEAHRYCYFTRQSLNTSTDKCNLIRESSLQPSKYTLKATTQENVTNLNCEVSCVD